MAISHENLDPPKYLIAGAVSAGYFIFDELVSNVPPAPVLQRLRDAIAAFRRVPLAHREGPPQTAAIGARLAKATARLDTVEKEIATSPLSNWCTLAALAELAAFHAGAYRPEDISKAFDLTKPHERAAAMLIEAVFKLATMPPITRDYRTLFEPPPSPSASKVEQPKVPGYVYLGEAGTHFKIGHTRSRDQREASLKLQLPEKLVILHWIETNDPSGVERYWHKQFADRRKNGEWFVLTEADISLFTSHSSM